MGIEKPFFREEVNGEEGLVRRRRELERREKVMGVVVAILWMNNMVVVVLRFYLKKFDQKFVILGVAVFGNLAMGECKSRLLYPLVLYDNGSFLYVW